MSSSSPQDRAPGRDSVESKFLWTNMNTGEVLPDVISPATWSFLESTLIKWAKGLLAEIGIDPKKNPITGLVGGRVYFNLNTTVGMLRAFPLLRDLDLNTLYGGLQEKLEASGHLETLNSNIPKFKLNLLKGLLRIPRFAWWYLTQSESKARRNLHAFSTRTADLAGRDFSGSGDEALFAELDNFTGSLWQNVMALGGIVVVGISHFSNLNAMLRRWMPDIEHPANALMTGLGGMSSAEAGLELWRLAQTAHEDPETEALLLAGAPFFETWERLESLESSTSFRNHWQKFMIEHGHHARGEIEVFTPRWIETPDQMLDSVRNYLRNFDGSDPLALHAQRAVAREELADHIRSRLKNPLKRWLFNRVLKGAARGMLFRENVKSETVRMLYALRKVLLELGRRLHARELLEQPDDVFFLELQELGAFTGEAPAGPERMAPAPTLGEAPAGPERTAPAPTHGEAPAGLERMAPAPTHGEAPAGLERIAPAPTHGEAPAGLGKRARERRAEYDRNLTITPPSVVLGSFDPSNFTPDTVDNSARILKGLPVSPGRVTGKARVILRSDTGEQVLPGEILVAPFTDPGWTPYFLPAAAIVMDMGGQLSHGSIVAREYGIPAVVNVGPATQFIRTGQRISVDGTRGEVKILELSNHEVYEEHEAKSSLLHAPHGEILSSPTSKADSQ